MRRQSYLTIYLLILMCVSALGVTAAVFMKYSGICAHGRSCFEKSKVEKENEE